MPLFAVSMPGMGELMVILVIVLLLFGAGRVTEVFSAFGKGIKSFKDAQREDGPVDVTPPRKLETNSVPEAHEIKEKVQ